MRSILKGIMLTQFILGAYLIGDIRLFFGIFALLWATKIDIYLDNTRKEEK